MKAILFYLLTATAGICAVDLDKPIPELRLAGNRTLKNVLFVSYSESTVVARWQGGMGGLKYADMPADIRDAARKRRPASGPVVDKPSRTAPEVSLAWSDTTLEVTNLSTKGWETMVIYLNDVPDGFRYTGSAPAIGHTTRLDLTRFVNKAGERYNPIQHGIVKAWVGGGDFNFRGFTPQ